MGFGSRLTRDGECAQVTGEAQKCLHACNGCALWFLPYVLDPSDGVHAAAALYDNYRAILLAGLLQGHAIGRAVEGPCCWWGRYRAMLMKLCMSTIGPGREGSTDQPHTQPCPVRQDGTAPQVPGLLLGKPLGLQPIPLLSRQQPELQRRHGRQRREGYACCWHCNWRTLQGLKQHQGRW